MKVQLSNSAEQTKAFTDINYIDLDFADVDVDGSVVLPVKSANNKAVLRQLKVCHVAHLVINQSGPGGNNPEIRLFGSRSGLVKYLTKYYDQDSGADLANGIKRLLK